MYWKFLCIGWWFSIFLRLRNLIMYMPVCLSVGICMWDGAIGGCEPPCVGAGNQTQISARTLCNLYHWPSLQLWKIFSKNLCRSGPQAVSAYNFTLLSCHPSGIQCIGSKALLPLPISRSTSDPSQWPEIGSCLPAYALSFPSFL